MTKVAVNDREASHHSSCDIGRRPMELRQALEEPGEEGQNHKRRDHANAIDSEAAEPLPNIVAVSTKDKELVTEIRHRDRNGDRRNAGEIDDEKKIAVMKKMVVQHHARGIHGIAKKSVPRTNDQIAQELATGE